MRDLAVVGLGALGVHVAAEAAARGLSTAGFEAFGPAHERGATGGSTRIFRLVYTFGGDYLPALLRAADAWAALERRHPGSVRHGHGALTIGDPADPEIAAAVESARAHGIGHEVLDSAALAVRWPQHRLLDGDIAVADPAGALLLPRSITAVVAREATAAGARLRYDDPVTRIDPVPGGHEVVTASGHRIRATRVLVSAGAWTARFAPEYAAAVELRRVVLQWYATPDPAAYGPDRFPVGVRRSAGGIRYSFFPQTDSRGVKVNFHVPKLTVPDADAPVNPVPDHYAGPHEATLRATLPALGARTHSAAYVESYTPDYRILLDRIAGRENAWLLAGGSGQAFKLAPALAEHAVARILGEQPPLDLHGVVRGLAAAPTEAVAGP
ncbi:FAD-dependent oxidoreductase [Promicromonospora vindobonensis]|uniref:FAD-dependent oxidoreductase n=1 Tax=Promicromonospora vindobonensis TaxID=195748 RepID=A0ABW5VXE6_9MICO